MPIVLPAEWEEQLEHARHNVLTNYAHAKWTRSRLKKCFEVLMAQSSEQLRFCFFIDGLDEYDGEHCEIGEFFSGISTPPFVKLCISTRPWPVFKTAFSDLPQLRLQDLTHNDIQKYVQDKLNSNKYMRLFAGKDPSGAKRLVEQVILKANGVFLWVTLVVTSLLRGLTHNDSIQFLEKRLNEISANLEGVYDRMLSSVEPVYQERGSKIFQFKFARERINYIMPTDSIFHYALGFDLREALSKPLATETLASPSVR